jgi:hypothetical protein
MRGPSSVERLAACSGLSHGPSATVTGVATDSTESSPERKQTDESLRTEREDSDRSLIEKQSEVQSDADLVVQCARDTADAVLVAAREKADDRLDQAGAERDRRRAARAVGHSFRPPQASGNGSPVRT